MGDAAGAYVSEMPMFRLSSQELILRILGSIAATAGPVTFVTIDCCISQAADQPRGTNLSNHVGPVAQLAASARAPLIRMIADQTRGNYERIGTWRGIYSVYQQQYLSPSYVANAFGTKLKDKTIRSLTQEFSCTVKFSIDMQGNSFFSDVKSSKMTFIAPDSKEVVVIPSSASANERSIVTASEYLHCDPKQVWPGFSDLATYPEARSKRAAFRDPPESAVKQHLGDLLDPRRFLGFDSRPFDTKLRFVARALEGELGEHGRLEIDQNLAIFEENPPNDKIYRFALLSPKPTGGNFFIKLSWSQQAGFHPILYEVATDSAGKHLQQRTEWHWGIVNGVYVPLEVKELLFDPASGRPSYIINARRRALNAASITP